MRKAGLAVMIVLLMIAVPLCASPADADDTPRETPDVPPEAPVETVICGYVGDLSPQKNIPLKGVLVKLLDDKRQVLDSYTTDEDGYFEVRYTDGAGCYLSFDLEGYTVRIMPTELSKVEGEVNLLHFSHDSIVKNIEPNADGKYQITSDIGGGSFVVMRITTAYIVGYVQNAEGKYISNAKVELKTSDGLIISGYTNSDGFFKIECYFGSYVLTVSCSGFIQSDEMPVSTDNKTLNIVIEEKSHQIFLGLDTPHTWEFLSLIFMLLAAMLFLVIYLRIKKGKSSIVMVNDLELEPEKEEKE